jgi:hypothetical protein
MENHKEKRPNDSSDDEERAEIANSSPKKQKIDDENEYETELEYAPLIFHHLSLANANEQKNMTTDNRMTTEKSLATESKQNTYRAKSNSNNATHENDKEDEQFKVEIIDRIADIDIKELDNSKIEKIAIFAQNVYKGLEQTFLQSSDKRLNEEFPFLYNIVKLPKTFIMTEMKERFAFSDNKILIRIDENIQLLHRNILDQIGNFNPLLFLTGLGDIGKSTALYAVQSYLRLNDAFRIIYIHDVEELFFSSAKLKNEIYFTFHQYIQSSQDNSQGNIQDKSNDNKNLIKAIMAFEENRIFEDIRDMFELLLSHCDSIGKKLILIIDNYNKIDSLVNTTQTTYSKEQDLAIKLNGLFRRLKCHLKIISASSNNETQQCTKLQYNQIYYDSFTLSPNGIKQYAHFIRTNLNYTNLPNISQVQAEAIQQLTNGIYLEVIKFFICFKSQKFNFKEGVNQYKVASINDSQKKTNDFFEKRIRIKEEDNKDIQQDKRNFKPNFYSLLLSMKSGTSVSSRLLKYMDRFLMFYKNEGIDQYKIFARNQEAYEMLI